MEEDPRHLWLIQGNKDIMSLNENRVLHIIFDFCHVLCTELSKSDTLDLRQDENIDLHSYIIGSYSMKGTWLRKGLPLKD